MTAAQLKPLAKIRNKRPLLIRRAQCVLSRALEAALFDRADVLSEGGTRPAASGQVTYFGSTMLSIAYADLAADAQTNLTRALRGELLRAVEGSIRVRLRAMRLARAEAARRVHRGVLGTVVCELRVRDGGKQLHIDVDLEAEVRVSSRAKRS